MRSVTVSQSAVSCKVHKPDALSPGDRSWSSRKGRGDRLCHLVGRDLVDDIYKLRLAGSNPTTSGWVSSHAFGDQLTTAARLLGMQLSISPPEDDDGGRPGTTRVEGCFR
jgi:hypothetical protein